MSNIICRLCLNDGKLIDIFDSRLTNSEQLRKCILLGTGVEIRREDVVTKYICQYCSDLAIFLYRYRKKAIANDKALKELANEQLMKPLSETTTIVQSNRRVFEELEAQTKEIVTESETIPETRTKPPSNYVIHPTVIDLVKTYPTLKLPHNLLKCHIKPRVALNPNEVESWTPPPQSEEVLNQTISEFERFKMMCPGILITKVGGTPDAVPEQPTIIKSEKPNPPKKRKSTESPISKRMKTSPVMSSKPERCKSNMAVSETEKPRSQTSTPHIEKPVPKLKISLRRSPDQSEFCAVIMNDTPNSEENLNCGGIQNQRKNSRESPVLQRNTNITLGSPAIQNNQDTAPVAQMTKGSFLESLAMQRQIRSPKESPVTQRSREPSVESQAIQHNIENNVESTEKSLEPIIPRVFNRNRIIESDSDDDDRGFDNDRGFDTENLLDTFTEEIVITCGVCNKMFTTPQQRRAHERVHRCCVICKMIFRSQDALLYHQREICFKKVIASPPNLELVRVDEQPEMTNLYAEALTRQEKLAVSKKENNSSDVLCISDDDEDDDDVIIVGESIHRPKEMDSEDYRQSPSEFQFISRIFGKYHGLILPNTKIKATETKPRIFVKYNSRSQIVLENMFAELQSYRVPVELIAKPNPYAYISFTKKPPKQNNVYCWASEPVIGLNEKTSFLSILLNTQSGTVDVQRMPQAFLQLESTPKTISNIQTAQRPSEIMQTPINLPQTSVPRTQPVVNHTQLPIIMTQTPVHVTQTPVTMTQASVITTQSPTNMTQAPVNAAQNSINMTQTPLKLLQPTNIQSTLTHSQPIIKVAIPRYPRNTYIQPKPSTSNSTFLGSIATTSSGLSLPRSVPSTSTNGDMNFGLRVKTLSELL